MYFITFRLADSMPKEVQERAKEYKQILDRVRKIGTAEDISRAERELLRYVEKHLDAGYGNCILKTPGASQIVWEALHFGEGSGHHLYACAVMPNHVHAVVSLEPDLTLDRLTHSWKSYSAHKINATLGRSGRLWEPESFDHIVRTPAALQRFVRYVAENPRKAGLSNWEWVFPSLDAT